MSQWIILSYTIYTISMMIIISFYLKRKVGENIIGRREIPKNLIWISIFGIIGTWIVILIPIIYIFYINIVDLTFRILIFQNSLFEIIAVLLIVIGVTITTIAMIQLGYSARIFIPNQNTNLITSGVYCFCRNPAYIGTYFSFFGIFLLLSSLLYLIGFCFFLVGMHIRILHEEKFLIRRFGSNYENYKNKIGRYLPKIYKSKNKIR